MLLYDFPFMSPIVAHVFKEPFISTAQTELSTETKGKLCAVVNDFLRPCGQNATLIAWNTVEEDICRDVLYSRLNVKLKSI